MRCWRARATPHQYQGNDAVYEANDHALTLTGRPKATGRAVNQEQTIVVGDTIVYQDSARMVHARGDTVTVEIHRTTGRHRLDRTLDVRCPDHSAVTSRCHTVFPSGGNRWIIGADAQGDDA